MNRLIYFGVPICLALFAGCDAADLEGRDGREAVAAAPAVVDSVIPVAEALERFRADLAAAPDDFEGGHDSPEALVRAVLDRLAAGDTTGFEPLAVDRAEFAWLVYPESPMSKLPYELPPALMWFRLQQENRIGVLRMLRELGGREYGSFALRCPQEAVTEGANRVLGGCTVRLGEGEERRLFGALVERGGRWKVLSFANDF